MPRPRRVSEEADLHDVVCADCGNERSSVIDVSTGTGRCAWCLTERVEILRALFQNRYRRRT